MLDLVQLHLKRHVSPRRCSHEPINNFHLELIIRRMAPSIWVLKLCLCWASVPFRTICLSVLLVRWCFCLPLREPVFPYVPSNGCPSPMIFWSVSQFLFRVLLMRKWDSSILRVAFSIHTYIYYAYIGKGQLIWDTSKFMNIWNPPQLPFSFLTCSYMHDIMKKIQRI